MTTRITKSIEGRFSPFPSRILLPIYGRTNSRAIRSFLRRLVLKSEQGPVYSLTIREMFRRFHGVDIGLYTIGPCGGDPENYSPGTVVGRYSSIYYTTRAIGRAWPYEAGSPQSQFIKSRFASPLNESPVTTNLLIGNDVFIGHNAIILPTVTVIGDGAFIGAGSVVAANVPPYAVVTGNPARVVRYRFSTERIRLLLKSEWWKRSIDELSGEIEEFQTPLEGDVIR